MILKRFCLIICFLFVFNCSSNKNEIDKSEADNQDNADTMYINAMEMFNTEQLDEAIIAFNEIERIYPLSN